MSNETREQSSTESQDVTSVANPRRVRYATRNA